MPRGKPFEPGHTGRPPGTQNKFTRTVKETVLAVFNELQEDPEAKLSAWAKKETTEFYRIAAKLIPTEVQAKVNHTVISIKRGNRASSERSPSGPVDDPGQQEEI